MIEDIDSENMECLDIFANDIVTTFMNTTDLHADEK